MLTLALLVDGKTPLETATALSDVDATELLEDHIVSSECLESWLRSMATLAVVRVRAYILAGRVS